MKKLFLPLIVVILACINFISCDKIDDPIPNDIVSTSGISWDDSSYVVSNPAIRKVVIEEFTGHLCTFCPNGARELARLDSIYGNQIIPVSIHAGGPGGFADPIIGVDFNGDGTFDYETDFRTPSGNSYFSTFGVPGNPAALISRINNATAEAIYAQWEPLFLTIKNDVPQVSIGLSTLYDDSTRTVKTVVNTEWLSSATGNYNLQLYLLEDSIVDWQLDNSVHIQFYMHRHVFRKAINGTWGDPLTGSNAGDKDTIESAVILPPEWDKNHCIVVAHIYKEGPSYEILQGEELHVIPH